MTQLFQLPDLRDSCAGLLYCLCTYYVTAARTATLTGLPVRHMCSVTRQPANSDSRARSMQKHFSGPDPAIRSSYIMSLRPDRSNKFRRQPTSLPVVCLHAHAYIHDCRCLGTYMHTARKTECCRGPN